MMPYGVIGHLAQIFGRPEFYYECDWNGGRIIVIVQTKK